jgi:hypothetical protein
MKPTRRAFGIVKGDKHEQRAVLDGDSLAAMSAKAFSCGLLQAVSRGLDHGGVQHAIT